MHKIKPSLLFAVCAWSLLILRFGYRFGTGDQVELLPYTLFLHNPALYPHDFFLHGLNASVPNERTVMAYLLLPFVNHLEIVCLLLQFASTIVLIMGLERLAAKFIKNKYLVWLSILVALIPLNDFALGNVEIYSECLQASGIATAMIIWAINMFLERRFLRASALLSLATFIQLLEGLDVMILLSAIIFFMLLLKEITRKTFFAFISIYALTAGIYLVTIFAVKSGIGSSGCKAVSNADLFNILFQFRHPHHFIFRTFPKLKMIVFFLFTVFGLIFYSKHSAKIFEFMLFGAFGVILYALATDDFHNIFIANFQFYKVTQWMKFLGVVAGVGLLEGLWLQKLPSFSVNFERLSLGAIVLVSWLIIIKFNHVLPYSVPYQLFGLKQSDDMIEICEQIKDKTPQDALFIQPFENSELKFYGQRSSFVEFKANVRHACYAGEWYRRIQLIYGLKAGDEESGFNMQEKADNNFYTENLWQFNNRSGYGITHMLVKRDYKPPTGTLILWNESYAVYKL